MSQLSDTTACSVDKTAVAASSTAEEPAEENLQDGVPLHKVGDLRGHESRLFSAEFSPKDDGLLVTSSEDNTCRVWDVTEGKQILALRDHTEAIYSATWSPDGNHLLTGGSDGKIILWDAHTGRNKAVFEPGGDVFGATFLGDDRIISASDDNLIIWDIQTGMRRQSKKAQSATDYVFGGRSRNPDACPWVFCLEGCQEHGILALGISDATVRIWDLELEERVVFRGHAKDVCSLNIKRDGSEVVSGSGDAMAGIWDLRQLQARLVLKGHSGSVHDSCYLPNSGHLCTVSNDKTLRVWDPLDGAALGVVGPGVTAKLCCAPSLGLNGVAVGGGENKSLFGADFRVALYSAEPDGLEQFKEKRESEKREKRESSNSNAPNGTSSDEKRASEERKDPAKAPAESEERSEDGVGGGKAADHGMRELVAKQPELAGVCKLSEEEIEDLSLKSRLSSARQLREAVASGEWKPIQTLLVEAGERLLFDVDEDAPKHAQEELALLLALKNKLSQPL
mmetsp:Transcript_23362/g.55696  ORF Transcript_23362/g.55696 Transcript_23362/m.55696 type:complete len:509 (-) Transcript_23362:165-1691(-)